MRKLTVFNARSMNNGIIFFSKRHKGYASISILDEFGNITTEWTNIKEYNKSKNKQVNIKLLIYIVAFAILYITTVFYAISKNFMLGIRVGLVGYSFMQLGVFFISVVIDRKKEKESLRFHSAEHMVLNAFRRLERIPSIHEIRKFSKYSNFCGTNVTAQIVVTSMLMFVVTFISNPLFRLIGLVSAYIIVLILLKCGLLNFLQFFKTQKPTERELIVAIEGMRVWLEHEGK